MENVKIKRSGNGIRRFAVFVVAVICIYFVGFSDVFCKNCQLKTFAKQLPAYQNKKLNTFIDVTKETFEHFSEKDPNLFEIAMLEGDHIVYSSNDNCKCMLIFSETRIASYGMFGVYAVGESIDLVFEVKQKEIVPLSATLTIVGW